MRKKCGKGAEQRRNKGDGSHCFSFRDVEKVSGCIYLYGQYKGRESLFLFPRPAAISEGVLQAQGGRGASLPADVEKVSCGKGVNVEKVSGCISGVRGLVTRTSNIIASSYEPMYYIAMPRKARLGDGKTQPHSIGQKTGPGQNRERSQIISPTPPRQDIDFHPRPAPANPREHPHTKTPNFRHFPANKTLTRP